MDISLESFRANRVAQFMEGNHLDLLVASNPEHILYLLNFTILGQTYQARTQNYAVVSAHSDVKRLVISPSDAPTAVDFSREVELVCHGSFHFDFCQPYDAFSTRLQSQIGQRQSSPAQALIEAIRRFGGKKLRIGIDELRTPVTTWNLVAAAFPDAELVPALSIFEQIRCVKHPEEIAQIEKSTHIAEDSLLAALDSVHLGSSEYEIGMNYRTEVAKRNAHGYFCTCTIDKRTAFSDTCHKKDVTVQQDSLLRFDYGANYDFYRSDLARTVVFGNASEEIKMRYAAILAGLEAAEAAMKPGVLACEVFHTAMAAVKEHGIPHYERHHCGHGIGLQIYDPPSVSASCTQPLEEGMVLCIETPYYEIGKYGIQIEDTVAVTANGIRRLTHTSNDLIYL